MKGHPKLGMVALCDAVYKDELTSKVVLAGLFSGGILIETFPSEVRFAMYVEFHFPDTESHDVELLFYVGKDVRGGVKVKASAVDPTEPTTLLIPQFGMQFLEPTTFELRVVIDGGKPSRAMTKTIKMRPSTLAG